MGLAAGLVAAAVVLAWAADVVVVEDWTGHPVATKGIPPGWESQRWGSPHNAFAVVEDGGLKVLHLKSGGDNSTIGKEIRGKVNLKETPVLEWSWKVITLPRGADGRQRETDDQAAQLYIVWPRFPEAFRSRIIGYIWDTTAPAGSIVKSQKTGTVTYIVLRSGPSQLGKWVTERRNVREDFKTVYGDEADDPSLLALAIDSNDVQGSAESYVGAIRFRRP